MREALLRLLRAILPEAYIWSSMDGFTPRRGNTNSVGIIIQPGPQTAMQYLALFMTNPEEIANLWGHSALYVRRNGQVVYAVGFDPHRLGMAQDMISNRVSSGRHPTQGYYYDERVMFRSPDALIVEFPVDDYHVEELLSVQTRPRLGRATAHTHQGYLTNYLTRDGQQLAPRYGRLNPNLMGNCINFITQALARSNLVVSASRTVTSSRTRQRIAAPNFDMSPAQGQLTNVTVQSFRTPTLVLHDLDSGQQINPIQARRVLGRGARFYRRMVGGAMTLSVARLVGAAILPQHMAPDSFVSDYVALAKLIIDIFIEAFPADSFFWRLQPHLIEAILAATVKFSFLYGVMSGDMMGWLPGLWMMITLLMGFFA